ncbi:MAG: SDR family oxidoreductase [Blastochloris sp.]|nr:SDR family oxidoreductase [Blastochloris sp.]
MSSERILVTGASSGIGEGFARAWAAQGKALILTARRVERLEKLATELRAQVPVELIAADLSQPEGVDQLVAGCQQGPWTIVGLLNNAGLGWQSSLAQTDPAKVAAMLQVNMSALTMLSRAFLPGMIARRQGFILNIASTAAFQPVPYFAVYSASKAYVLSLSEALHEEAREHGVHVAALCPGPVATEFQEVAGMEPRFFCPQPIGG